MSIFVMKLVKKLLNKCHKKVVHGINDKMAMDL